MRSVLSQWYLRCAFGALNRPDRLGIVDGGRSARHDAPNFRYMLQSLQHLLLLYALIRGTQSSSSPHHKPAPPLLDPVPTA